MSASSSLLGGYDEPDILPSQTAPVCLMGADPGHFCIYDAPTPEAVRTAAEKNGLPVERITEVRVLDPYFYA